MAANYGGDTPMDGPVMTEQRAREILALHLDDKGELNQLQFELALRGHDNEPRVLEALAWWMRHKVIR